MQKVNRILIELLPIAPARHTLRLHIIVDSARETDASIPHYRRLRQPDSRARHTDASIRVSFWKKKLGAIVGTFIANYRRLRPADGHFFIFDNYIYRFWHWFTFVHPKKLISN